jgi:LAO/AO transport system kinase
MIEQLAEEILAGQPRAVAKAITMAETGGELVAQLVARLRPHARGGHLIGLTGAPGAGKSSLIGKLAKEFRDKGKSVGVLAVDPSSPVSGGAVLGDRVRMHDVATDPEVFVRSMASRGRPGGLAPAVEDAAVVLKAAGKEIVLVETVGVGQGEVDVANIVQTVVVVLTPGMGDEVQSLKAGLLEVADLYVVNKADLPGADAVARSLLAAAGHAPDGWIRPVLQTSTTSNSGIADLAEAIESHREHLCTHRGAGEQELILTCKTVLSLAGRQILDALESTVDPKRLERIAANVVSGALEPREAAQEVIRLFFAAQLATDTRSGEFELAGEFQRGHPGPWSHIYQRGERRG